MQETFEYIKQAFELKSQNCYKQAIEMLYKALELESNNIEILFQLGELYFLLKNFPRATRYLEKVLQKDENHIEALKLSQKIHIFSNNLKEALELAEKIYSLQKSDENLIEIIKILSKIDFQKLDVYTNTNNDKVLFEISNSYYQNGKVYEAKLYLEKALSLNPNNEDALVLLGKIYFDESNFDKSKNIFNSFSKTSENPEVLNYLGLFALEDLNFIDAIKYFSKASNIDSSNSKYCYNLANAYFYNGWIEEATKSYLKAICMNPENCGYHYSLAYLYYETGNFEKSQKEIDFLLEKNYTQAHVLNALLKFEKKDYLGAKTELESIYSEKDNFVLVSLAKVYKELSMFEKAENAIHMAIINSPKSLNYKCQLSEIFIAEKKYAEALKIIDELIESNDNYIEAYRIGAKAAIESGNLDKAKEFAQKSIGLDMNFAAGYYYLALVRFKEKDYEEAIECMKRAIIYDLSNDEYYAAMSTIYREKEDFKTALEYMKEAESICSKKEYQILYKELISLCRKNS